MEHDIPVHDSVTKHQANMLPSALENKSSARATLSKRPSRADGRCPSPDNPASVAIESNFSGNQEVEVTVSPRDMNNVKSEPNDDELVSDQAQAAVELAGDENCVDTSTSSSTKKNIAVSDTKSSIHQQETNQGAPSLDTFLDKSAMLYANVLQEQQQQSAASPASSVTNCDLQEPQLDDASVTSDSGNRIGSVQSAHSEQKDSFKTPALPDIDIRMLPRSRVFVHFAENNRVESKQCTFVTSVSPALVMDHRVNPTRKRLTHGTVAPRGLLLASGTWCYRARIIEVDTSNTSVLPNMRFGWATSAYISKSWKGDKDLLGDNSRSWAFSVNIVDAASRSKGREDGFLLNAREKPVACGLAPIHVGDTITVAIDLDRQVMRFGVNEELWNRDGLLEQERGEVKAWGSTPLTLRFQREQLGQGIFPALSLPTGSKVEIDFGEELGMVVPPGWEEVCNPVSTAWNSRHNLYVKHWAKLESLAERNNSYPDFWQLLPYQRDESEDDNSLSAIRNKVHLAFDNIRISDNGADELADYLLDHVAHIPNEAQKLDLSHNQLTVLGQLPAVLCEIDKLSSLDLRYNRINDHGARKLSQLIRDCRHLRHLDISHNQIGDQGAVALATELRTNSNIEWFSIASNSLTCEAGNVFKLVLQENQTLQYLSLCDNGLGDVGLSAIAAGLTELHSIEFSKLVMLQDIDLSRCKTGVHGIQSLAHALATNTTLQQLSLESNGLTGTDIAVLCQIGLSSNLYLQHINLSRNPLGDGGGTVVAKEFVGKSTTLVELKLRDTQLSHNAAVHIARAIQTSTSLVKLDLSWNLLGEAGVLALAEAIPFVSTLRYLSLAKCGLQNSETLALLQALSEYGNELESLDLKYNSFGGKDGMVGLAIAQLCASGNVKRFNLISNKLGSNESFAISEALALPQSKVVEVLATGNLISAESIRRMENAPKIRMGGAKNTV